MRAVAFWHPRCLPARMRQDGGGHGDGQNHGRADHNHLRRACSTWLGNDAHVIARDQDRLLAYFDYPAEHWKHLRTTNPIESTFATVRLREGVTKGAGSRTAGLVMAFNLLQVAEGLRKLKNYCFEISTAPSRRTACFSSMQYRCRSYGVGPTCPRSSDRAMRRALGIAQSDGDGRTRAVSCSASASRASMYSRRWASTFRA